MEGHWSTGQSPQGALVPMEEEGKEVPIHVWHWRVKNIVHGSKLTLILLTWKIL